MTATDAPGRRFLVALSFPGEHRDHIAPIAEGLAKVFGEDRILYDQFHDAEFARPNLDVYLPNLYRTEAELIVVVLCTAYAQKKWCKLEWRFVRSLIASEDESRIMLLRIGDIEDPEDLANIGILDTDGYIDITHTSAETVVTKIQDRLAFNQKGPSKRPPSTKDRRHEDSPPPNPRSDVDRLLAYVPPMLIGRESERQILNDSWTAPADAPKRTRVLSFVALGGEGKTALIADWLADRVANLGAPAFAWSFYSQGTRDQTAASADAFLASALAFFNDQDVADSPMHAVDKAKHLLHRLQTTRTLLVLDGLEPLQHAPTGPHGGRLKDQAMATLLRGLALQNPGLCIITTRYRVPDLDGFEGRGVDRRNVDRLSVSAGVQLLKRLEVHGPPADLEAAVNAAAGHALSLNLLGTYLRDAHGGDVRRRDRIRWAEANEITDRGHAFRVMDAYVTWLESEGEYGRRATAALQLLGLFDRPVPTPVLNALLKPPAIEGLTDLLVNASEVHRNLAFQRLQDLRLITRERQGTEISSVDAHPLIREYFAERLSTERPEARRAGHGRVFEYLCESTDPRPDTLEGLQPLYQAVAHGCQAGRYQEACVEVYGDRILRGTGDDGFYSTSKLGALGADLGAVAGFFDPPWTRVVSALAPGYQAWLLNEAASRLRALGRSAEALEPMRAGLQMHVGQKASKNAAIAASSVSELALTLGQVSDAVTNAQQAVIYADDIGDAFQRMARRTIWAAALFQAGRCAAAEAQFRAAETLQAERQTSFPRLYSLPGFRFADYLLGPAETAAQAMILGASADKTAGRAAAQAVTERAREALEIVINSNWLLDIALDHLSLGRAALYTAVLTPSDPIAAAAEIDTAVNGLRRYGAQHHLPRGLLTRAWLRAFTGQHTGPHSAQTDLDEAWTIAEAGDMRLHMADIHLYRARLFYKQPNYPWTNPSTDLTAARHLIETCGYLRRLPELELAESVIGTDRDVSKD